MSRIESSLLWYERVSGMIQKQALLNIFYKYIPANPQIQDKPHSALYIKAGSGITSGSLEYAQIDGLYHVECALTAIDLLKHGGILILDKVS